MLLGTLFCLAYSINNMTHTTSSSSSDTLEMVDYTEGICWKKRSLPAIRKVTLRSQDYDVHMTSVLDYRRIGAVSTKANNKFAPSLPDSAPSPYIYLENWNNTECDSKNSYKMRFIDGQVQYAYVTPQTWELNIVRQVTLVTESLTSAAEEAWRRSLDIIFQPGVNNRVKRGATKKHKKSCTKKKRKSRKCKRKSKGKKKKKERRNRSKRCSKNIDHVKNKILSSVGSDDFKRDLKVAMKQSFLCNDNGDNASIIASTQPWLETNQVTSFI